ISTTASRRLSRTSWNSTTPASTWASTARTKRTSSPFSRRSSLELTLRARRYGAPASRHDPVATEEHGSAAYGDFHAAHSGFVGVTMYPVAPAGSASNMEGSG